MLKRVYISCNSLPNTQRSLEFLYQKLYNSSLKNEEIILVHDSKFKIDSVNSYSLNIKYVQGTDDIFEYSALHKMWEDSQNLDFYGLYLHCKGSSKTDEIEFLNNIAWAEYMLFGLIENIDLCLYHLENGADLVGSMWFRHFKGNFFWCKSSFIKKLFDPLHFVEHMPCYGRYAAEYWCSFAFWYGKDNPLSATLHSYRYGNDIPLPYPKIKNLFYLSLQTDADFLNLKKQYIIPDLNYKSTCYDINEVIKNEEHYLGIYDKIIITKKDFEKNKDVLFKFMNYDSEIILC